VFYILKQDSCKGY